MVFIEITLIRLKGISRLFLLTNSFSRRSSSTRAKESTFQYLGRRNLSQKQYLEGKKFVSKTVWRAVFRFVI